ncbi:MAG TPA: hypothetical protein VHX59_19945 [Mycobacteriales bacterium]|jgi:hypothetical protein|nr:hypothetical protein [Mycobacteriales bacterium]
MQSEAIIVERIMSFANQCGDPAPSALRYVRGTRGAFGSSSYNTETHRDEAATSAILVEATGQFTWRHSAPHRASPYTSGHAISLVIDELTGAVVSRSIRPEPLDLSSYGQVNHPAVPK